MKIQNIKIHTNSISKRICISNINYVYSLSWTYVFKNTHIDANYIYCFYKDVYITKMYSANISNDLDFKIQCLRMHLKLSKTTINKKINSNILNINKKIKNFLYRIKKYEKVIEGLKKEISLKESLKNNINLNIGIDKKQMKEYVENSKLIGDILND